MKATILPLRIEKRPENQVKTKDMYVQQRSAKATRKYHPDGLMSDAIFGWFGTCKCGELTHVGFCEQCNTRVVDPKNLPDYFIDLGLSVTKYNADFSDVENVKDLLLYKAYAIKVKGEWEIHSVSLDNDDDFTKTPLEDLKIGVEAARLFNDKVDTWANTWMTDFVSVPHPNMRPNLRTDRKTEVINPLTKHLQELMKYLSSSDYGYEFEDEPKEALDVLVLLYRYDNITENYHAFEEEIFRRFAEGKTSWVHRNLVGHSITGAIRATVINRFDIDEDVILIGDTFAETLWPYLYKKFNGDVRKINDQLVRDNTKVLVSRQPTISELSIQALKPRIASTQPFSKETIDEEIDTIGIRCVAVNPIIMDGFAGDFDGDTLFVIALYSKEANEEAAAMLPSKNFLNSANGEVRNGMPLEISFVEK